MTGLYSVSANSIRIRQLIRRLDWILVVAIAPLMLFPDSTRPWLLFVLPLIILIQAIAWEEILPLTPLNPIILLITLMMIVSIFITPNLSSSLEKIAGLLFGILVYFTGARHARDKKGLWISFFLFASTGLLLAFFGILGTNWQSSKFIWLDSLTSHLPIRFNGLPGAEGGIHPNELAGSLLWIIPVVIMTGFASFSNSDLVPDGINGKKINSKRLSSWRTYLFIIFIVDFIVLILTQSRGSILALIITALFLLIVFSSWRARRWIIGLAVISLFAGGILIWKSGWTILESQVINSQFTDFSPFSIISLNWRLEIWSRALMIIKAVPLTGLGMNIFRHAVGVLYPTFQFSAATDIAHAHNEVLQAALDLGIPGLIGFLGLYFVETGMLIQSIRRGDAARILAFGLLAGLFAHFLYGLTDAVALGAKPGFLFWWLLGIGFGLYYQNKPKNLVNNG